MNTLLVSIYFVLFALIAGSGFAMMWGNIKSINDEMNKQPHRHPEAPLPGEKVMYVDLNKQRLEQLYQTDD